jgi:transcriptional regulator with XRE-family HTH domain
MLAVLVESRKQANITQVDLAHRLGKQQSFVSKYENAERRIDVIEFIDICEAIGVDAAGLVSRL